MASTRVPRKTSAPKRERMARVAMAPFEKPVCLLGGSVEQARLFDVMLLLLKSERSSGMSDGRSHDDGTQRPRMSGEADGVSLPEIDCQMYSSFK